VKLLKKFGFEMVQLEDISIYDQIRIFRDSNFIVAPHGAGLSNVVFSDSKTKVIEIFSPMYVNVCYWSLCNQKNIKYGYIATGLPHPPDGWDPHLVSADILVDTGILERMVRKFL
jgi:capsular polysaccharide biosynthesis protein